MNLKKNLTVLIYSTCRLTEAAFLTSSCLNVKRKKRGMLIYTLRIKRREIREIQIKYAGTPLTCINEEGTSTVLMTKDLRLPCESGIKNTLLERLITVAHTDSYLCEHAYKHISYVGDRKKYRVHAPGFACLSQVLLCTSSYRYGISMHKGIHKIKKITYIH